MKFADKEFNFYWPAIQWPTILLSIWIISGLVLINISTELYESIHMQKFVGNVIPLVLYFIAGYLLFADHKSTAKQSAWAGALTGILTALVAIVVGIILLKTTPYLDLVVEVAMAEIAAAGQAVDPEMMRNMIGLTTTIMFVLGPVFSGLTGALFGWLGGLTAKKVEGKK